MKLKSLYAFFVLALQFIIHMTRRILHISSPGLKDFLKNYRKDKIPPLLAQERTTLLMLSRCMSCQLCELEQAHLGQNDPSTFLGAWFYPMSVSRSTSDYTYASLADEWWEGIEERRSLCPQGISVKKGFDLIKIKAGEVAS
jgi:hypothetical protein